MSSRKKSKANKRKRDNYNKSLQNLLETLRKESAVFAAANSTMDRLESTSESLDNTVISLDDSQNDTVVPKKRKLHTESEVPNKVPKQDISTIVINDEDAETPRKVPPLHSSTPKSNVSLASECNISKVNQICDLTKEINPDSYLTIDLTTETNKTDNTVIDLENSNQDCMLVSVSNASSASSDSNVTVISKNKNIKRFARGIANMNAEEKGRLLDLITHNIFNDTVAISKGLGNLAKHTRATETAEDTYIKEVILGQSQSRNSIGSNIYNPEKDLKNQSPLRMIVIDGSNVAMDHGKGRVFSVKGLQICIDYFVRRGHVVKAFVPRFRCKFQKSSDPRGLDALERRGLVVYTPSREVAGKLITSYDDRYIVQCAAEFDGVIVSGDNYRDLIKENPRWRFVIENRLLQFTWVNDMIMFPKDPMGRNGPTLEQLLRRT